MIYEEKLYEKKIWRSEILLKSKFVTPCSKIEIKSRENS